MSLAVLVPVEAFLAKTDARDKLTKIFQEFLRAIVGFLAEVKDMPEARKALIARLKKAMSALGEARRTFRWFKEVSPVLALREGSAARKETVTHRWLLAVGSKVALLGHILADRYVWLQKHAGVAGVVAETDRRSKTLATMAHTCNMLLSLLSAAEARGSAAMRKHLDDAFKFFLNFLQDAHFSKLLVTHDGLVGCLGVITSVWDVHAIWKKLNPPPPPPKPELAPPQPAP